MLHPHRARRSRRDLLRVAVQAGAAGLTLPALLQLRAEAAETAGSRSAPRNTSVIQIWLGGGPSHFETYDPKPLAPAEIRGPFSPIATRSPGVYFSEHMPQQAALVDRLAVIRSVHHTTDDHHAAMHWCQTGHHANQQGNFLPTHPSLGSVTSRVCGPRQRGLPPYVHLGFPSGNPVYDENHHAAYIGAAYKPFRVTDDPSAADFRVNNLALADGTTLDRLDDRRWLLSHMDRVRRDLDARGAMEVTDQFQQAALELLTGKSAREAFDLGQECPRLRDRYGRNRWGQSALLARRLVERGVTFVTVNTDPHSFTWDMHASLVTGGSNEKPLPVVGPQMDQMVAALVEDLHDRGLARQVLVLVWGEFGRTPRVNPTGGRDHWGGAMSVVMACGGLRTGQVIGSTNARGESPQDRLLAPADVLATVYRHLGIDPEQSFVNTSGRPVPILNSGEPIAELLA